MTIEMTPELQAALQRLRLTAESEASDSRAITTPTAHSKKGKAQWARLKASASHHRAATSVLIELLVEGSIDDLGDLAELDRVIAEHAESAKISEVA